MAASAAQLVTVGVALPVCVALSTHLALRLGMALLGPKWGYLAGFVFPYWALWCFGLPAAWFGAPSVSQLLRAPRGGALPWLAALAPALALGGLGWRRLARQSWRALAASAAIAAVNGAGEELLWRGVFLRGFGTPPNPTWAAWAFTGVAFPLWHVAFLTVERARMGNAAFLVGAAAVGLLWGWVAQRTGSLRAPIAGHVALNFVSLIGARYFVSARALQDS